MSPINTTRRDLVRRAAALSVAGIAAGGFQSRAFAASLTLRLATSFSNDPNYSAARVWNDKFTERLHANCGDEIVVKFFPDSQLGKESDIATQLKLGVVEMMVAGSAIWATVTPEIGLLDLGYLFKDFAHQTRVLESESSKFLDKLLADIDTSKKLKPRGLDHLNGHFAPEESETCASTQSKPSGSRRIRTSPSWKFIPTKG